MSQSTYENKIIAVAASAGSGGWLFLPDKPEGQDYTLIFTAAAWGSTGIQLSAVGGDTAADWCDEEETVSGTTGTIAITKNSSRRCPGGVYIRLNPTSLSGGNPITMVAK